MTEYFEGEYSHEESEEDIVKSMINTLADGLFSGEIEDTRTPQNGDKLHLDTLIKEEIGYEDKKELKMLKDRVYARLYDLAGGCIRRD